MKIVVLDAYSVEQNDLSLDALSEFGEVVRYPRSTREEALERVADADVIFTNKVVIDEEMINAAPHLKYISEMATGYNNIDIEYAKSKGIYVSNVPEYATRNVVELVFAMVLALQYRVHQYNKDIQEGAWIKSPDFAFFTYPQSRLYGKTMGIVGYGSIGREVAKIANAFGMDVLMYSRTEHPSEEEEFRHYTDLDDLLKRSDVVTLHVPLNEGTKHLMNKETLQKMKKTAVLINTARGPVVHEADLVEALRSGTIAGAALDVIEKEPMQEGNPLLDAPNLLLTPHIAWAAKESREILIDGLLQNMESFQATGKPHYMVN